ncbi:subtilisin-like protease SBT1.4 [Papaver somniferum]|uniref:subtilisin-like protease SBT1.4 n=1 Tax=Papaver somniferum TaxID=3469 RepID=UPI000E6FE330|nr:subtilisin-like protease SBT1.4 [Papaver somniferum]
MCKSASSCIPFLLIFLSLHISCSFSQLSSLFNDEKLETYIVHVSTSEEPSVFTSHKDWYRSILQSVPSSHDPQEILYTYTHAANGFAARLTPSQASHLSSLPGIISILPEQIHQLQTTRTSEFLNLRENLGLSAASIRGDNVIIGVIDSGICPGHPSFNDSINVPERWKGTCESGPDFPESGCNRKLIGARAFWKGHQAKIQGIGASNELKSPRDTTGHGTHCASIAAGSYVNDAGFYKYAVGQAKGVATRERIVVYKVCWSTGCPESDILAAMDQAVADGVDIISLSVCTRGSAKEYHQDLIAIAAFGAMEKGILVSCATGNAGPGPSTAVNIAPCILTVGASTIDRQFPGDVHLLGDSRVFSGVSLYTEKSLAQFPQLVFAGNSVTGKIVVCNSGDKIGKAEKGREVQRAGGVGMIVIDSEARGDGSIAAPYLLPATTVSYKAGLQILKYIKSAKIPRDNIHFAGTTFRSSPSAPQIASFSSRGPNYITP